MTTKRPLTSPREVDAAGVHERPVGSARTAPLTSLMLTSASRSGGLGSSHTEGTALRIAMVERRVDGLL